jgi:serine protease Do
MKIEINNRIIIIIYAAIFGLMGGIAGCLITRGYFNDAYIPVQSEINYSDANYKGTNLIIRDAKKVVVEQNEKTRETIDKVNSSIVGIFKKKGLEKKISGNEENYYLEGQKNGEGVVITSDGWIISNFKDFKDEKDLTGNYVAITKDKNIYPITALFSDKLTKYNFIHIEAKDLPVNGFTDNNSINTGDYVLALNWDGKAQLTQIINNNANLGIIKNSDTFIQKYESSYDLAKNFKNGYVFDLSGNLAGLIDDSGSIEQTSNFIPVIKTLLKNNAISRISFGITYVEAEKIAGVPYKNGALIRSISKGSAADLSGLKSGQVISSIDGVDINKDNDLLNILRLRAVGDKVLIRYLNNSGAAEATVILKELRLEGDK